LRRMMQHRLGDNNLSEEIFQRAIDLLTFKSIIRRATPSIVLAGESAVDGDDMPSREGVSAWCFEFSHQHFWTTVLESAKALIAREHDLVLAIVWIAGRERLPLYSSAFLSVTGLPFTLSKGEGMTERAEYFLRWSAIVVKSLWSQEPQQCLKLLMALRPIRNEITWRFGPDLSEEAMEDLLELHGLLVEALRPVSPLEAERDLEHAAVLEKFIQASATYTPLMKGVAKGKVASLRAIMHHGRTSYVEFERWANEARSALAAVPETNLERARLLTLLVRTKGEALLNAGRFKEADALIDQGKPVAELLAESRFDEYSLYYRVAVTSKLKQDQNDQATELTTQIMLAAKQRGNTLAETMFLVQATIAAFSRGDLTAAIRYSDHGMQNGRRYGIRFAEIMSTLWRMIAAGVVQDPDKVRECSQQLAALVEDARVLAQSPNLLQRITIIEGRATAMNFLGRFHAALEYAEEAIQLARSHDHESFAAWGQNEKALALVGLGRFEDALSVATASIELAGEQLMAERTARTALIGALTGLGRLDEARREIERIKGHYKDRNPYYLRFALMDARLMRQAFGNTLDAATRQSIRTQIIARVTDILELVSQWDATKLRDQIQKEFEDLIPKQIEVFNSIIAPVNEHASDVVRRTTHTRLIRTFGPLTIEQLDTNDLRASSAGLAEPMDRDTRERDRDSKERQLIAMLVMARAEASEARSRMATGALTREQICDRLWPDTDSVRSGKSLPSVMKRTRGLLGGVESIELSEDGYRLADFVDTDCERVLRHYAEARQARKRNALFSISFHYEQILRLSDRGVFFDGIYGPWLDGLRTKLSTIRRSAMLRLIQTDLDRGLLDRVEDLSHKLLSNDEFDEEALRALLTVSARRRQTGKLAKLYSDYSQRLKSEFRSEPSIELRAFYADLTAQVAV
jgi:DNA-binding SARP family transcriptional activator